MSQFGPLYCHTIRQATLNQGRLVSNSSGSIHTAFSHVVCSVVRNSAGWYKRSKFNDRVRKSVEYEADWLTPHFLFQYDIGLCAYTSLMRIVAKFHGEVFSDPDTATGLNKVTRGSSILHQLFHDSQHPRPRQSIDFKAVTQHHDEKLTTFNDEWKEKFAESDTGGKWSLPCIIFVTLIHSPSKLCRIFLCLQEFFTPFVRARQATGALGELTCSLLFLKPRKLFKTCDAFLRLPIRLRETC